VILVKEMKLLFSISSLLLSESSVLI